MGNSSIQDATEPSRTGLGDPASQPPTRRRPYWLRRSLIVVASIVATLVLTLLAVYAWAWSSTDTSSIARAMIWMEADVGDQLRFPPRPIPAGQEPSPLPTGKALDLAAPAGAGGDVDGFLHRTDTLAFLIVHHDRLVYERYLAGSERRTLGSGRGGDWGPAGWHWRSLRGGLGATPGREVHRPAGRSAR